MSASFTPGPWFYQEQSDAYTHIVRQGDGSGGRFICQLGQDTSGVAEANARLIAAAPDLYGAVLAARSALMCGICEGNGVTPSGNLCPRCLGDESDKPTAWRLVNDALKQARGER